MVAQLRVEAVSVIYGEDIAAGTTLEDVSFVLEAGEFTTLVGASGSGKSTLLRVLAGLQPPSSGTIWLDDTPVTTPTRRMAVMFQDANLMPWRTVTENIALPLELAGDAQGGRAAARALLPALGLDAFADAYPAQLSGGMAQRVALGRVLIQHPDVLLLDEPFGALDAFTREQVSADLVALWERERPTILMITHDIQEAVHLSDRVLVLGNRPGHIVDDVRVPTPRPRDAAARFSAQAGQLYTRIFEAVSVSNRSVMTTSGTSSRFLTTGSIPPE